MATQYVINAEKKLYDLEVYVSNHNIQEDDFAKSEIEQAKKILAEVKAQPVKYLVVQARNLKEIEQYLGFGAAVSFEVEVQYSEAPIKTVVVIDIPEEHANWLHLRLGSGMIPSTIFDSAEKAVEYALTL